MVVGSVMGSTSYLKPKGGYRAKSGSSGGSDKEMNGKLRRPKIRRPTKLAEYGFKRIPDYTELAYKEAVSKLRYFLSGNYAPSVRSYGGSASIKNLDESDGDLDKKCHLPAAYGNLSEFKPRPRLTAKYASLYADSLNQSSYTPQHHVSSAPLPPPGPAEPAGGTNPDVIHFIHKQEEYIEQLERESQYCRDELNTLLGKVKEVISENEHLHEAQKNKIISRMFHSCADSETDEPDDSTGLDSDNKLSPSKARKSRPRSSKLEGPNIVFESRIAELEAQLTQAKIDLKKVQDENNENKRKLASGLVDSTCLDGFKRQIDNLQRDKASLEAQISKLKLSVETREEEQRRGEQRLDSQLRDDRNQLEAEVRRLKEDLAKERSKVRELAGEGSRRAVRERSAAEQRYSAHFDELQHDLAAQYDNVAKLQLDLERQRREENDLKRELSMKNAAIEELKMELKNKTATLQADLAQAYAEKASLEEELASARLAIERHQRQAKHDTNRLNSEIQSLRQRLDRADADLVHSRRENLRLAEQISNLEKELNMKGLTPTSPERRKEKELSTMLESMDNKHAKTVAELESMIQSQNSLMEKLTGECRLLTDKLDDANRRHKQELGSLQRQVETLGRSLQTTREAPSTYQAQPPHLPTASRNVSQPPGGGQEHPRVESSGDPDTSERPLPHRTDSTRNPQLARRDSKILSRQSSKASIKQDIPKLDEQLIAEDNDQEFKDKNEVKTPIEQHHYDQNVTENYDPNYEHPIDVNPYSTEHQAEGQFQQSGVVEGIQPDTSTDQFESPPGVTGELPYDQTQIDNTEYDQQQYVQQEYPEGSYENYEQYPQQYTDPNAQYEGNYENYATDATYQGENFDNTQYSQEYTPEYQAQNSEAISEVKRSNSPNEKLTSQS